MKNNKKILGLISLASIMFVLLFGVFGQANAQPEVLKECIKIRQNFTLNITTAITAAGVATKNDVSFVSGAIVAPQKITVGSSACTRGATLVTTASACPATGMTKATDCFLANSKEYGVVGMFNTIYNITNWVFFVMTLIAVLMIVYGGFTYITAAGDPAKAGTGKSILTYAIIGLAIALIAKLIPSLVRFILRV